MKDLLKIPVRGIHRHRCGVVQGVALLGKGHGGLGEAAHHHAVVIHAGIGAVGKDLFAGKRVGLDLHTGNGDDQLLALGVAVHSHHIVVLIGEAGDGDCVIVNDNTALLERHGCSPLTLSALHTHIVGSLHGDLLCIITLRQSELALVHDVLQNGGLVQLHGRRTYLAGNLLEDAGKVAAILGGLVVAFVLASSPSNIELCTNSQNWDAVITLCCRSRVVAGHSMHILIELLGLICRIGVFEQSNGIDRDISVFQRLGRIDRIRSHLIIKTTLMVGLAVSKEHHHLVAAVIRYRARLVAQDLTSFVYRIVGSSSSAGLQSFNYIDRTVHIF